MCCWYRKRLIASSFLRKETDEFDTQVINSKLIQPGSAEKPLCSYSEVRRQERRLEARYEEPEAAEISNHLGRAGQYSCVAGKSSFGAASCFESKLKVDPRRTG